MGTDANVAEWVAIRDVVRQLDVSQPYVNRLIHQQRLHAIRTRLGWLVDPVSVAAFERQREGRQRKRSA
jgi:hypothetical protein